MEDISNDSIINWYECSICHHKSKNLKNIEKCLAQGKNNLYKIGQKIEFRFSGEVRHIANKIWFKGEITGIKFRMPRHGVTYKIRVLDSELPNNTNWYGKEIDIAEGYVRPIL